MSPSVENSRTTDIRAGVRQGLRYAIGFAVLATIIVAIGLSSLAACLRDPDGRGGME